MKRMLALVAVSLMAFLFASGPAGAQESARIHLIHGIPGVDVDVEVGGEAVITGFSFGDTEDLSALAGETLTGLQVKVAGTDDVAIDAGDVALPASGNYSVIAHLDADGNPTLGVFQNDTSATAPGEGRLVVRHTAAAPAVDVLANGEVAFSSLANGSEASADLPAGTVTAEVAPAGTTDVVIGPADLPVTEGASLIVYAVGSVDAGLDVLTESIDGLASAPTAVNTGTSPVDNGSGTPVLLIAAGLAAVALGVGAVARTARARA